jgi:hypothetical protein
MIQLNLRQSMFKLVRLRRFVSTAKDFVSPVIRADRQKSRVGRVGPVESLRAVDR